LGFHLNTTLFDPNAISFVIWAMGSLMLNTAVWHHFAARADADPLLLAADATA